MRSDPDKDPRSHARLPQTRKTRTILVTLLVLFILYSVTGFIILPYYGKKVATEKLTEQLGRHVVIGKVGFNPYVLTASITGFEIREADGRVIFVSFNRLYVDLSAMSLFKGGPVIGEIKLEKPHVHLVRTDANTYNFSALIDRFRKKPEASMSGKPGKPVLFSLSNIQIMDGDIEFDDRPTAKKHEITQINLAIPFISNLPSYVDSFVQPSLSAVINGTLLNLKGSSKVFADSRETSLDISVRDIDIPSYAAYFPAKLNIKVASGKLDVVMKVAYRQFTNRAPILALQGESRIRDLGINTKEVHGEILKVPLLSVKDISFDLETRKIEIGAVATEKGRVSAVRSAEGRMNYGSLMASPPEESSSVAVAATETKPTEAPWIIVLKSIAVDDYTIQATDRSLAQPFEVILDRITCHVQNISTGKNAKGTIALSLRIGRTGSAEVHGGLVLDPLSADLAVRLEKVRLKLMQPYLAERAHVLLADGTLNVDGTLTARRTASDELSSVIRGNLRINKLSLLDAVNAEDLLKLDSLSLNGIEVQYAPLSLRIREIALVKLYSRIIVNADKTINLQEAFKAPESAGATEAPAQEPEHNKDAETEAKQVTAERYKVKIDKITLRDGTINFTDDSIKPRFSSNLFDINGHVSGLSSGVDEFGEVELAGRYDRYAPLQITGRINPLRDDLYVALKADFKDMDLTSVSPYSGRYAGYAIQKGKLSFQLEYQIDKNKLDAQNNVFIDQFTFGDHVESPDATKLPVRLAVALLKDRNGQIRLDIPVAGELNDPKFSVGRIVLKVIVNLLEKAATSPFALLGALFGGGEEISYAEFDDGSAVLTDEAKKKLNILEKALGERPSLSMDIIGHADSSRDSEGLKKNSMLKKIKAQKMKEVAGKNDEAPSLELMTVTPEEYPLFLKRAYQEERFKKPRNFLGIAKDLPVPEMEKLMLDNIKVTDEDLKALAVERVKAVRDYLLQSKRIEPERIFIVETRTLEAEKKEGVKNSRTDFQLK